MYLKLVPWPTRKQIERVFIREKSFTGITIQSQYCNIKTDGNELFLTIFLGLLLFKIMGFSAMCVNVILRFEDFESFPVSLPFLWLEI